MAYIKCIRNLISSTVPDGKTVTPTDDISIWLACGGRSETYTTLSQVLADSTCTAALMADDNAVDYLVRSTTWASSITGDEDAMDEIGANNYCADQLLGDSTWNTAICNSVYFESVLNLKVPVMTSNTTPSGSCYGSPAAASGFEFYKAFDENNSTYYSGGTDIKPGDFLGYNFQRDVNCRKVYIRGNQLVYPSNTTIKIVGVKNEGGSFVDYDIKTNIPHTTGDQVIILDNPDTYVAYKFVVTSGTGSGGTQVFATYECQFYGRADI